ncbi:MAG TPA: hypothetical protein VGG06_25685 [Thermoanaerobaculia bacterium]|jgi:hypothetical protein
MGFRVLVIPEDFRKDEHLLRPILQQMISTFRGKAKVIVCTDPLLGGVAEALKWSRLEEILDRYRGMVDCFLLIVDRDGKPNRRQRLDDLERQAETFLGEPRFFAENAWQEVEVWALAGMTDLPGHWSWDEVRQDSDSKEVYFEPYAETRGLHVAPFGGRKKLGEEAARNYGRIRKLCPEDVEALEKRLRAAFE